MIQAENERNYSDVTHDWRKSASKRMGGRQLPGWQRQRADIEAERRWLVNCR